MSSWLVLGLFHSGDSGRQVAQLSLVLLGRCEAERFFSLVGNVQPCDAPGDDGDADAQAGVG